MSVLLVLEGAIVFYVCQCVSMSDEAGEGKGDRMELKAKRWKEAQLNVGCCLLCNSDI